MKKNNNKGFTLMEMLIVVAIIAILVAIAIPVFTNQLEKARETTDLANIRSAYAEVLADYLLDGAEQTKTVALVQTQDGWEYVEARCGDLTLASAAAKGTATVKCSNTGVVSVEFSAAAAGGAGA